MRIFTFIFIFSALLLGCDKPNPNPELLDPIFADLQANQKKIEGELKGANGELEGFIKDLSAVVPQTGQIKYAQKRVDETRARIKRLEQMLQYYQIRAESRRRWAQEQYLKAYNAKKAWPDPEEFESYKALNKMQQAPRHWDAKGRLERAQAELKRGNTKAPASEHAQSSEH